MRPSFCATTKFCSRNWCYLRLADCGSPPSSFKTQDLGECQKNFQIESHRPSHCLQNQRMTLHFHHPKMIKCIVIRESWLSAITLAQPYADWIRKGSARVMCWWNSNYLCVCYLKWTQKLSAYRHWQAPSTLFHSNIVFVRPASFVVETKIFDPKKRIRITIKM